jgi:hypothetical protein
MYFANKKRPTGGKREVRARNMAIACATAMEQIEAVLNGSAEPVLDQDRGDGDVEEAFVEEELLAEEFVEEEVVTEEVVEEEILIDDPEENMAADISVDCDISDKSVDGDRSVVVDVDDVDLNKPLPTETIYVDHSPACHSVIRDDSQEDILAVLCAEFGLCASGEAQANNSD